MKILFAGYFGFSNLGDDLLAAAAVAAARRHPRSEITILSSNPALSSSVLGVPAVSMFDFPAVLRAVIRCDRLVFGGGGVFQDQTSRRSLGYYLGVVAMARATGKSVGLANIGVDPISSGTLSRFFKWLVSSPSVSISVRDESSRLAAVATGVSDGKIRVTADGVFAMDPAFSSPPSSAAPRGVLLVVRVPPPDATDIVPVRLAQLGETIGLPVAVAALQPGADEVLARSIAGGKHASVLTVLNERSAFPAVAGAEFVASGRYHALVLAALTGRPFLGFGDTGKIRSLCSQFGMPFLPWDAGASAVGAAFDRLRSSQAPNADLVQAMRAKAQAGFDSALGSPLKESRGL